MLSIAKPSNIYQRLLVLVADLWRKRGGFWLVLATDYCKMKDVTSVY
jgi:hypothetical protein